MRPEQLKSPFSWKERQVLIKDRVWYVPDYYDQYDKFSFPGWTHPDAFGNDNPVHVEYCSGNGDWIAAKAAANPLCNWVAVELQFERVRKIWSKMKNGNLSNLLIICGEALTVTSNYFPSSSVDHAYMNFPDPWPKNSYAKKRLIQSGFIRELHRTLKSAATFDFVTDDPKYSEWTLLRMGRAEGFSTCYPTPGYITDNTNYGSSFFERLWREKGKEIRFHRFVKKEASTA